MKGNGNTDTVKEARRLRRRQQRRDDRPRCRWCGARYRWQRDSLAHFHGFCSRPCWLGYVDENGPSPATADGTVTGLGIVGEGRVSSPAA